MNTNKALPDASSPVLTLAGRIGWTVRFTEVIFDDPPCLVLQAIPVFPGCSDYLAKRGIVWDVFALIDSAKQPGAYQVLTCECGYAPDADLYEAVLVGHPDEDTIVWELDIVGLRPALEAGFEDNPGGFVRLIFVRDEYEADIRALLRELQRCGGPPIATLDLTADVAGVEHLHAAYPNLDWIRVDTLEPDTKGMALERLLELDADASWIRKAIWPNRTLVEFGFFARAGGHELIRVNGELSGAIWPGWYFTRWQVLAAFKAWLSHVQRAFWLGRVACLPKSIGKNEFVLLTEAGRISCHAAGRQLAAIMQISLNEGKTAPGVIVRYCECPLNAASTTLHSNNENNDA